MVETRARFKLMLDGFTRRVRPFRWPVAAFLIVVPALTGCHSPPDFQARTPERTSPASTQAPPQSAALRLPSPFDVTHAGHGTFPVESFTALLERYSESEQATIKSWYANYAPHAMSIKRDAQWQWMQQHDYPTPDDVLQASLLSDAQLRELAMHGDVKANFFYLARLLERVSQANAAAGALSDTRYALRTELIASMNRALGSGSAFAGYMYGAYFVALHGQAAAGVGAAAGLTWAHGCGDWNALFGNEQMLTGFPGVSGARVAEAYFDMTAAAARINPRFQDAYRGHGELSMPSPY